MKQKYPRSSVTEENKLYILEQRKIAKTLYNREYNKKYHNSEHGKATARITALIRQQSEKGKLSAKLANAKHRKTELGKISRAKSGSKWTKENKVKVWAHKSVYRAITAGKLIQPSACEGCSIQHPTLNAHHDDYSLPLKVRWLCPKCHYKWHKINGSGING